MELDGSTSLKSRRAIADALEVDPAYLDIEFEYQESRVQNQDLDNATPEKEKIGSWSSSFAYPGVLNTLILVEVTTEMMAISIKPSPEN
jgi:hypothetical protein